MAALLQADRHIPSGGQALDLVLRGWRSCPVECWLRSELLPYMGDFKRDCFHRVLKLRQKLARYFT